MSVFITITKSLVYIWCNWCNWCNLYFLFNFLWPMRSLFQHSYLNLFNLSQPLLTHILHYFVSSQNKRRRWTDTGIKLNLCWKHTSSGLVPAFQIQLKTILIFCYVPMHIKNLHAEVLRWLSQAFSRPVFRDYLECSLMLICCCW